MYRFLFINFHSELHVPRFQRLEKEYEFKGFYHPFTDIILKSGEIFFGNESIRNFDYVFVGLMQKHLEPAVLVNHFLKVNEIPHFRYGGSKDSDNKLFEDYTLNEGGFPSVKTIVSKADNNDLARKLVGEINFPIIAKPIDGAKGRGVEKLDDEDSLSSFIASAEPNYYLFQPFIRNNGDYRVFIVRSKIVGIMKRESTNEKEFRSNISLGGVGSPAELPDQIKKMCMNVVKYFDLDIAGVDVIQDQETGEYFILEVNRAPQFKGLEKYIEGLDIPELIIESGIQEINSKRGFFKSILKRLA